VDTVIQLMAREPLSDSSTVTNNSAAAPGKLITIYNTVNFSFIEKDIKFSIKRIRPDIRYPALTVPDIRYPAFGLTGYPAKTVSGASLFNLFRFSLLSVLTLSVLTPHHTVPV
jgi:hypothetical protein